MYIPSIIIIIAGKISTAWSLQWGLWDLFSQKRQKLVSKVPLESTLDLSKWSKIVDCSNGWFQYTTYVLRDAFCQTAKKPLCCSDRILFIQDFAFYNFN